MFNQLKLPINQYEKESETENIFSWQVTNFHTAKTLVSCQRLLSTQSLQKANHWALNNRTICMELSA